MIFLVTLLWDMEPYRLTFLEGFSRSALLQSWALSRLKADTCYSFLFSWTVSRLRLYNFCSWIFYLPSLCIYSYGNPSVLLFKEEPVAPWTGPLANNDLGSWKLPSRILCWRVLTLLAFSAGAKDLVEFMMHSLENGSDCFLIIVFSFEVEEHELRSPAPTLSTILLYSWLKLCMNWLRFYIFCERGWMFEYFSAELNLSVLSWGLM